MQKAIKIFMLPVLVALFSFVCYGQVITTENLGRYKAWPRYTEILKFYQLTNFQPAWIGKTGLQLELVDLIKSSSSFGLNEQDYQFDFIQNYSSPGSINLRDSLEFDIRFTDAALHFFTELKIGNEAPLFAYSGLTYEPDDGQTVFKLATQIKKENICQLAIQLQPQSPEYYAVLNRLNYYLAFTSGKNFRDAEITSTLVSASNKQLVLRLFQLGILDSFPASIDSKILLQKLKYAQKLFGLPVDGRIHSATLKAFNTALYQRVNQLKKTLNVLRWFEKLKQNASVLLLNIPAAYFMVYENGSIVLDSKIIAGKKTTPTPTLTSTISEVILYPYWMVPQKIAVNELLPAIKRNVNFLEAGNFQLLDKEGRVLDPYEINWREFSKNYFPYIIRQSTGCDNALGIIKFNFYNPFTVYLHDTPGKTLFSFTKRFFSHGCMRVEKPEQLARFLLGSNQLAIDTLTAKGCVYQQSPVVVHAEKKLPVIILYSTAWYNKEGEVCFYEDIYGKGN